MLSLGRSKKSSPLSALNVQSPKSKVQSLARPAIFIL